MEGIKISLDSTGRTGDISVVRVDGVIDTMTATELEGILDSLLKQQKFNIIIDLAGVDYISSAGWGIFISNIREIRSHSGDIKLARMIPSVHEIFELLEFDSILQSYENIEKARTGFQPHGNGSDGSTVAPQPSTEVLHTDDPAPVTTEEYTPAESPEIGRPAQAREEKVAADGQSLEEQVLSLIKADPFYTIREIAQLINEGRHRSEKPVGWWRVWRVLRHRSLLSKKRRFRFSRR
jgi:anti-sigma B factor antagonist